MSNLKILIHHTLPLSFSVLFALSAQASHLQRDFPEPQANLEACSDFNQVDLSDLNVILKISGGGTSAYARVILPGTTQPAGAYIPPNSSGIIDGEVTAYRIALLLGQAENVQPATLKAISGEELTRFTRFMVEGKWTHASNLKNRDNILKIIDEDVKNGSPLLGALKCWNKKPVDYDELLSADHMGLNTDLPAAKWIRADQPQPSSSVKVNLNLSGHVGTATELQLARELSTQFLIDAIMGQWDRFGGGNLQVIYPADGSVHFGLFDNGGTWGEKDDVMHTLSYVTRFEKNAVKTILDLDEAFGNHKKFHGAKEAELQKFLEMDLAFSADNWLILKKNVKTTADYLRSVNAPDSQKYFIESEE